VVIAIISLLSSVVFASLNSARAKARDAKRVSDLQQIRYALELFTPSLSGSWVDVWTRFQNCLENGNQCFNGNPATNYTPMISDVPQDPTFNGSSRSSYTYSTAGTRCGGGQKYRLKAMLESTGHPVFNSDLDGSTYDPGGSGNNWCEDDPANRGYCLGVGTCDGWLPSL
jgi:type II secretory pathway pseudopilin PulG